MPNKINHFAKIAAYLVRLRLEKRKTQAQIASQVGIALTTYQRIEQGKRDPRFSELQALCDYHGISWLDMLLAEPSGSLDQDLILLTALRRLPRSVRGPIMDLIRELGKDPP